MADRSLRQQIMDLLNEEEMNSLEISQAVGIGEREVPLHLEHIIRTLAKKGQKLHVSPATCLGCGYRFTDRKSLKRPGRCPRCRESHLRMATYRIEPT
ncbi:MAG: transcriptional regulator [Deltaproteobacteria bacterium]|jgi:predicted Zn-ribbon and HTH transcriptional regulator|nr:transcriptional regulator [Deltaproteobacteria bacterium]